MRFRILNKKEKKNYIYFECRNIENIQGYIRLATHNKLYKKNI